MPPVAEVVATTTQEESPTEDEMMTALLWGKNDKKRSRPSRLQNENRTQTLWRLRLLLL